MFIYDSLIGIKRTTYYTRAEKFITENLIIKTLLKDITWWVISQNKNINKKMHQLNLIYMKTRKLKNYLKIGFLLLGVSFLLENCENNNDESIHLNFENSENLNLKTVSFQEAKTFFNIKIEKVKEGRNPNVRKGDFTPLELTPNWTTIEHDDLYGIDQAQLTLADVEINRSGDYISKLFFINRNEKVESIIFTMFPEEINSDGKIIEAKMIFNELNGDFIDGYRIEGGKITKRITVEKKPNVQKASIFMFYQDKVDDWFQECLGGGGVVTNEIVIYSNTNGGGINTGPTSHGIGGFTNLNLYYINNTYNTTANSGMSGSAGSASATSVAGSLYTQARNERELAEGEEEEAYTCYCDCEGTETEFTNDLENNMEPKWGQLANKQEILDEINSIPNFSNLNFDEQITALENHFNKNLMYSGTLPIVILNPTDGINKYVYTEVAGWLDFHHVFKLFKWTNSKGPVSALLGGEMGELIQSLNGNYSAYSYEDLPSNNVGVALCIRFGEQLKEGRISWQDAVGKALDEMKWTQPEKAPNFDYIPFLLKDNYPKNFTYQPLLGERLKEYHKNEFCKLSRSQQENIKSVHEKFPR